MATADGNQSKKETTSLKADQRPGDQRKSTDVNRCPLLFATQENSSSACRAVDVLPQVMVSIGSALVIGDRTSKGNLDISINNKNDIKSG